MKEQRIKKGRGDADCRVGALPLLAMTVGGCRVTKIGHDQGPAETPNGGCGLPRRGRAPPRNDRRGMLLPSPWGRVARQGRVRDRATAEHRIG